MRNGMKIGIIRITIRNNRVFVTIRKKNRKLLTYMQEMKYYDYDRTLNYWHPKEFEETILIRDE